MIFKIEQDTLIKWKTLCNKSCRYYFIESRKVEFVFFQFFYDFISILQVHCLMRPRRQDLNVIFFTFRSCRPLDGQQAPCRPWRQEPIFENFPIRHIFLKFYFFNIKMKKFLERIILIGPAHDATTKRAQFLNKRTFFFLNAMKIPLWK